MDDFAATTVPERNVFFEPPHYSPDEIEAVLPDGTRVKAEYQLDGRRLGFARPLPVGTRVLVSGILGWVVGSTERENEEPHSWPLRLAGQDLLGSVTGHCTSGLEGSELRHHRSRQVVRVRASRVERAIRWGGFAGSAAVLAG